MSHEIDRNSVIFTAAGGALDLVDDQGVLLATIAVPAGRTSAVQFLDLLPEGAHFQAGKDVAILRKRSRIGRQPYGEKSHHSGANPDFRPTSASRMEREMRLALNQMKANNKAVEARLRGLEQIERIPLNEVIERDDPAPVKPAPVDPSTQPVEKTDGQ